MKKVLSIAIASAFTLSLSACAIGNNRANDLNRTGINSGIDTRRISESNDITSRNVNYGDGVYTGYGDAYNNGNEMAVVEIRDGRISNINLYNIKQQGRTNNASIAGGTGQTGAGTKIDNQTGTDVGARNETITDYKFTPGNIGINTPGNTAGNTTGNAIVGRDTTGTPVGAALDGVRTNLTNMMIRDQRYDVSITNADVNLASTINNWKLAVRRALDQARI